MQFTSDYFWQNSDLHPQSVLLRYSSTVQCKDFGRWSLRSWRTGLLGVVKWRGVGVYLVGSSVWQGQPSLPRRREGLDQTRRCHCISHSLLVYRLKIPPAKNMHCTLAREHDGSLVRSALVDECETGGSQGRMSISSVLKSVLMIIYHTQRHTKFGNNKQVLQSTPGIWGRRHSRSSTRCSSILVFLSAGC
jgi:hypothetical protein